MSHPSDMGTLCERRLELAQRERGDLAQRVAAQTAEMQRLAGERDQLERSLRTARRLEAVGQLAAGVAHEVNTPVQFIGDGVAFLRDCLQDLSAAWSRHEALFGSLRARGHLTEEDEEQLREIRVAADVDFVFAEAPAAIDRTLRGVTRVADIVRALRAFAHPDQHRKEPAQVNAAIRDAAIVATGEYKHIAELELDLGDLPLVDCNLGELNQVFLNLIVNAAHAIAGFPRGRMGKIAVRSRCRQDAVEITISDDGCGMDDAVRARIFEPFFTTKPLGKGTGQGLALAQAFIEGHHGGRLMCESTPGVGTTFTVTLPRERPAEPGDAL